MYYIVTYKERPSIEARKKFLIKALDQEKAEEIAKKNIEDSDFIIKEATICDIGKAVKFLKGVAEIS